MYYNLLQYLVSWMGYDSLMLEPAQFIDGLQAVEEFHSHYQGKLELLENVLGKL